MAKYSSFKYSQKKYSMGLLAYVDKDQNKIPTNLTAIQTDESTTNLSWVAPINPTGISQYNIYAGYTPDFVYEPAGNTTNLNYSVKGLERGRNYYFAVTASYSGAVIATDTEDSFDNMEFDTGTFYNLTLGLFSEFYPSSYSPYNPVVSYSTLDPYALSISWQAPLQTGIIFLGYKVWRSTNWQGPLSGIATTTNLNYIDSGLDTSLPYYYRLTSIF